MKKFFMIVFALVWFAVAAGLTMLMIYGINKDSFMSWNSFFFMDDKLSDAYEKTDDNTYTTTYSAQDVKNFDINLISENFSVGKSTDTDIKVVVYSSRSEKQRPWVHLDSGTLEIKQEYEHKWTWNHHFEKEHVELFVPTNFSANDIKIRMENGEAFITSLTADEMKIVSVSGAIQCDKCTLSSFKADATLGSITFNGVVREFRCHSVSGAIEIASSQMLTDDSSAETVSGSVRVTLPENDGFILRYDTVSGRVHDVFSGSSIGHGSGEFTYKTNGPIVSLKTVSGSISVEE